MSCKIETHLHTTYVSQCGWMGADALLSAYRDAGYSGICVTDHYNRTTFKYLERDITQPGGHAEAFLLGVRRMRRVADKYGIHIYEGLELRVDGIDNDYLCFGVPHDMLEDPEAVFSAPFATFSEEARARGAFIIQAHPFRPGCAPADPALLDAVEVCNTCIRHNSHNDLALAFAKEHGLIQTSGSDCHRPEDPAKGGIEAEELPEDEQGLIALLRSRNYRLILPEHYPAYEGPMDPH